MKTSRTRAATLLLLAAMLCLGWADNWKAIRAAAVDIRSVQAEFVQEKHLPILAKPLISAGVFYYQAPDSLRWEYRRPLKTIMAVHDGRVRRLVAGPEGWTQEHGAGTEAMQVVLQEIRQWLGGRFEESTIFAAALKAEGTIELVPREDALRKMIQRIELELAEQPGIIESVTIHEGPDAYTRMRFSRSVLNEPIDESIFTLGAE